MRRGEDGNDADERLPIFLRLHRVRCHVAPEGGRLLRVLLLWIGGVPADPAFGSGPFLLRLTYLCRQASLETSPKTRILK